MGITKTNSRMKHFLVILLTVMLFKMAVEAPNPPLPVVTATVDVIEVNIVNNTLTQHVYWSMGTVISQNNGSPMSALINRGWRLADDNDAFSGISWRGKIVTDEFVKCGVLYRVSSESLMSSRTEYDVEIVNRGPNNRFCDWIVP